MGRHWLQLEGAVDPPGGTARVRKRGSRTQTLRPQSIFERSPLRWETPPPVIPFH
jgi:hypothetical protein